VLAGWLKAEGRSREALDALEWLTLELYRWNRVFNLVGAGDRERILALHVLDSLSVAACLKGFRVIDVGTGAGFPGLPLAILEPGRSYLLLDSSERRLRFARHVVVALRLRHVEIHKCRVAEFRATGFDVAVARAYAPPRRALADMLPLVAAGGRVILMQAKHAAVAVEDIRVCASRVHVPGVEAPRWLWIYEKPGSGNGRRCAS